MVVSGDAKNKIPETKGLVETSPNKLQSKARKIKAAINSMLAK